MIPMQAKAVPFQSGKVVTGSWDATAAEKRVRNWAGGPDKDKMDWGKYRKAFAWYDAALDKEFGSYKLPHHDIQAGELVVSKRGVEAAAGVMSGARGGADIPEGDRAGVKNHLAKHYHQWSGKAPWESSGGVLNAFYSQAWAISSEGYELIERVLMERALVGHISESEIEARLENKSRNAPSSSANVAVIPLYGPIVDRAGSFSRVSGLTDPRAFATQVQDAADNPRIREIILDVDSPGGTVAGTVVAADAVRVAAAKKRVTAVANDSMASGAYWIASQASRIVASPSAIVGSISVIFTHRDKSQANEQAGVKVTVLRSGAKKALGGSDEALTAEARAEIEGEMREFHNLFVSQVAAGRNMPISSVPDDGAVFIGEKAVRAGLADEVGMLETVLGSAGKGIYAMDLNELKSENSELYAEVMAEARTAEGEALNSKWQEVVDAEKGLKEREEALETRGRKLLAGEALLLAEVNVDLEFQDELENTSVAADSDEAAKDAIAAAIATYQAQKAVTERNAVHNTPGIPKGSAFGQAREVPGVSNIRREVGL